MSFKILSKNEFIVLELDSKIDDLEVSNRLKNICRSRSITTLGQLFSLAETQLGSIHGLGWATLCEVRKLKRLYNRKHEKKEAEEKKEVVQVGGSHYDMNISPAVYIKANGLDFFEGNIIKYVSRHRKKNGAEDIRKAISYCEMILEMDYGEKRE